MDPSKVASCSLQNNDVYNRLFCFVLFCFFCFFFFLDRPCKPHQHSFFQHKPFWNVSKLESSSLLNRSTNVLNSFNLDNFLNCSNPSITLFLAISTNHVVASFGIHNNKLLEEDKKKKKQTKNKTKQSKNLSSCRTFGFSPFATLHLDKNSHPLAVD